MLSGFKSIFSKSVEAFKQVQEQVVVKKPPAAPADQVEQAVILNKNHPAYDLLDRYETSWEEVVQNGAALKTKLTAEESKVKTVADKCENEFSTWANLKEEMTNLEAFSKGVSTLKEDMEAMCSALQKLDEALDGHLKAKEERDLVKWKQNVAQETAQIQASRSKDLEKLEKTLKSEQDARIRKKAAEEAKKKREEELAVKKEAQRVAEEERKAAAAKAKEEKEAAAAKAKEEKAQKDQEKAEAAAKEKEEKEAKDKAEKEAKEKESKAAAASAAAKAEEAKKEEAKKEEAKKEEAKQEEAKKEEAKPPAQEGGGDDGELEVDEAVMNAIEEKDTEGAASSEKPEETEKKE